jgi:alpha-glucosidase
MWVLSNHDITRHVTRYGRSQEIRGDDPLHGHEREPADLVLGTRRARAAILLLLALPGGVYLYQGEELGLPEVEDLPEELLQDPTWERSGHVARGRDGSRVPLPWTMTGPSLGFGSVPGWLPQPAGWADLSVEAEETERGSMLWLYRDALRLRRELPQLGAGGGELTWTGEEPDVLGFTRAGGFVCMVNTGSVPVPLPPGRVVLSSLPTEGDLLPGDGAAWLIMD